jgi:hypothetical protein
MADIGSLNKKETVNCFNELLTDFIAACEPLFAGTEMANDMKTCKTALKTLISVNITMPIEQYLILVYTKYGTMIDNNDVDGLLAVNYEESAHEVKVDMRKILNVKHLLQGMSTENRLLILQYLQMMNRFGERYYECNRQ